MHCANCGDETTKGPCEHCGEDPLLDGRWRLVEVLGRGGAGVTWRARDEDGDEVCVKELPIGPAADTKHVQLALREARVLEQLDHPQVPDYIAEVERGKGRSRSLFIVMELVEGADLASESADRRYTEEEVLDIVEELCRILVYLHQVKPPVVHRDIKPANVRRRPNGSLVLVDFGAVRDALQDRDLGGDTVAGTFGYMAPEQFAGNATERTDLYGVGALAVALLTKRDPASIQGHDQQIRWRKHVSVSAPFGALLDDLLALDPRKRPASAEEVLGRIADVRDPPEPPTSLAVTALHSGITALAFAGMVVFFGGIATVGGIAWYLLSGDDEPVAVKPEPKPAEPTPHPRPKPVEPRPHPRPHPKPKPHGPKHPVKIVWRGHKGQELFIDGTSVGRLPTTVKLASGTYDVSVKDGFIEYGFMGMTIESRNDRIVRIDLGEE